MAIWTFLGGIGMAVASFALPFLWPALPTWLALVLVVVGLFLALISAFAQFLPRKRPNKTADMRTMSEKNNLGNINVEMRDGNNVGHIGHVVNQGPPPRANGITQNGMEVGEFFGEPRLENGTYVFPKLLFDRSPYDTGAPFGFRSSIVRYVSSSVSNNVHIGGIRSSEFLDAVCEIVK